LPLLTVMRGLMAGNEISVWERSCDHGATPAFGVAGFDSHHRQLWR